MSRKKSDSRIVPEAWGNSGQTAGKRGGRAATVNEAATQLELFGGTADSPKGATATADSDLSDSAVGEVPKPSNTTGIEMPTTVTMEEVVDDENLQLAFERVLANRGSHGPDGQSVEELQAMLPELKPHIQTALLEGSYRPGQIRRAWIPKPNGDRRGLGIPNVVDRWIQTAIEQKLTPLFDPTFHESSHGFRKGRSCHTAIEEARSYVAEGFEWVVDIDLEKFFDRVNHQRLMAVLERRISDRRLTRLIWRFLRAEIVMPDGVVVSNDEGAPQGGPLSPLLSNIVLNELDWELEERGHRFVRYADDCNIYVRSERAGKRVMASISRYLERRMRLKVNEKKSAVARPAERHFLGFSLRLSQRTGNVAVLLSKRSQRRLWTKIRKLTPRLWGGSIESCIKQINMTLQGWMAFFRICSRGVRGWLKATDGHIRRRLRVIILRHWKKRRTIVNRLIALGVKPASAMKGIYGRNKGPWAMSITYAVHQGMKNAYLANRGLKSLVELHKELNDP